MNWGKKDSIFVTEQSGVGGLNFHQSKEVLLHEGRMWRNVGVMLFILALHVMQVIPFCMAIGRDPTDLKLAIVNHEINYTNMSYQNCNYQPGCRLRNLSCRYLENLNNNTIHKLYYPDPESAVDAVREGNAWGALYFTENFTDALVARMILGKDADEETLDQSKIRVWLDTSNQQIGVILQRDLQLSYQDFARELLKSCEQNPTILEIAMSCNFILTSV